MPAVAAEHHRPLAGTKLYCLMTEAGCEQLTYSRYPSTPDRESNPRPFGCKSDPLCVVLPHRMGLK